MSTTMIEKNIEVLLKMYTERSYEPAILLQGIYLEKTIIQKGTCTPGFPEALFTITKTGKPPKYLQTDG